MINPMKIRFQSRNNTAHRAVSKQSATPGSAFTRADLLCLIAGIWLVALMAFPGLAGFEKSSSQANCLNNLRQIGQALRAWGQEQEVFPWGIPIANGGSYGYANTWEHFLILSNFLSSPRVLACPSDTRAPARDFSSSPGGLAWPAGGHNNAVSYFLHMDALYGRHTMLLAGDRHLTGGTDYQGCRVLPSNLAYTVSPSLPAVWTNAIHGANAGNLLFVDGSAVSTSSAGLKSAVDRSEGDPNYNHHLLPPR
jgi:hypothetical protein